MIRKIGRVARSVMLGLLTLLLAAVIGSALSNVNLPTTSTVTERLSPSEKARLAEAVHLRHSLGDEIWPGWGEMDIPLLVYNEEYAFLVGLIDPADGWLKMPRRDLRGGRWEPVPDDTFGGEIYYRQRLPDPDITPENFTVLVGDRWVATMATKEFMEIELYRDLREEMPSFLRPIFPYRLMWWLLMGQTEAYIGGLEHELFHALQGEMVPERLAAAEEVNQSEANYPWDDDALGADWQRELDLLLSAVRAETNQETVDLARQFLDQRDQRRTAAGLDGELIDYERQREWLEGLAKYAELTIIRTAAETADYSPLPDLAIDPDFDRYAGGSRYWSQQVGEVTRTANRGGETRFYYSGMAQGVLLDRLDPGWKARAFDSGVMLEDLLREAVAEQALGVTKKDRIAVIYRHHADQHEHARTTAHNRGIFNINYFKGFEEGIAWLVRKNAPRVGSGDWG